MTYFVLQTAVLMLLAYLLGAIIGCMARQFFSSFPDRATAEAASEAPKIETGSKSSRPPSGASTTSARFERSLSDAPKNTSVSAPPTAARMQDPAPAPAPTAPKASAAPASAPAPTSKEAPAGNSFSPVAAAAAAAAATLASHGGQAGAATASATQVAPAAAATDDLTRIKGIDAETISRLSTMQYTSYQQIAGLTPTEVSRIDSELGKPGRISQQNWIEQAQILAKGGVTEYARRIDTGEPADDPSSAPTLTVVPNTPVSTAEQTSTQQANSAAEAPTIVVQAAPSASQGPVAEPAPAPKSPNTTQTDLAGLRSVRSEALVGTPIGDGNRDDLKRIRGVGVLIEKKLYSLGVATYEQVANWTQADIDRISQVLDFKGRIERENWVEQARILAAGGQTDFSRRAEGRA